MYKKLVSVFTITFLISCSDSDTAYIDVPYSSEAERLVEHSKEFEQKVLSYETPGGTILAKAHRAIESITLDRGEAHLKDEIMPKYAQTIYNGLWFSSERQAMQRMIDETQQNVTGDVKLKLFKGNVNVTGRRSPFSKYKIFLVSFDEVGGYDQRDAEGFIKITSLRLKK